MKAEPTAEQLESRREVSEFLDRVKGTLRGMSKAVRSKWFGRPDEELMSNIELGRLYNEVKDSRWMLLQNQTIDKEIHWAQGQLEACKAEDLSELRCYLKALRFIKGYILTIQQNADISSSVLAGRPSAISAETIKFARSVSPQERMTAEEPDAWSGN